MTNQLSPEAETAVRQIQKLLNLAAKNPSQEEAAAASAKAQELLVKYNLDAALIERASGVADGKREDVKTKGGFYTYQRSLWSAVAQLNFCMYWTQEYTDRIERTRGVNAGIDRIKLRKRHRLVGRMVNTAATVAMATYLEQTIERFVRERLGGDNNQLFSHYAMSYREGMADKLRAKVGARFRERLAEDKRKEAEAREKEINEGAPTEGGGHSLTLSSYVKSEADANNDFLYGEGWSARERAETARLRAEAAKARADQEAAWAAYAAAHPEEARKAEEEARKERERDQKRWSRGGRGSRGGSAGKERDENAYYAGREAAEGVSLDRQAEDGGRGRARIGGGKS